MTGWTTTNTIVLEPEVFAVLAQYVEGLRAGADTKGQEPKP